MIESQRSAMVAPPSSPLRRERNVILGTLLLLAAAAWGILVVQAHASMQTGLTMGMQASLFLLIWIVMMVAMMFPAAAPMILIFARVQAGKRTQGRAFVPTWIFAAAYVVIWTTAGAVGYVGAVLGERVGAGNMWFMTNGARLTGALLVLAGVYQFTPLKRMCLSKCRSPLAFVISSWRDGFQGAVRMGLQHGLYCFGCCWLLFVILFPLGMMNIALLAVLTLVIFAEKVLPYGDRVSWFAAAVLVAYGLAVVVSPGLLPTMANTQDTMHM
jgi:predicted metal-binding membrane protein